MPLSAGASDTADTLFQEVLGRKDKADSTRNALNVLQRFKFLFNLPLNIERNIQKVPATGVASGLLALYTNSENFHTFSYYSFLQLCKLQIHTKDIKYMSKAYVIMQQENPFDNSKYTFIKGGFWETMKEGGYWLSTCDCIPIRELKHRLLFLFSLYKLFLLHGDNCIHMLALAS